MEPPIDDQQWTGQHERKRLEFIRTEIDQARTYVRLSRADFTGGNCLHAADLLNNATVCLETATDQLLQLPSELFDDERNALRIEAYIVEETIDALKRLRNTLTDNLSPRPNSGS